MKIAECRLKSISPYSQSKVILAKKKEKELPKDFEERTWRDRLHTLADDMVFIPPQAFSNSVKEAAKYLSIQIPGQSKRTYTKNFESGVMVAEPLVLSTKKSDVRGEWLFVPANGKRGGPTRVWKCFPLIPEWKGAITFYILDDIITADIFEEVLRASGQFIGIGRFRPRNCGYYGRFSVEDITWTEK